MDENDKFEDPPYTRPWIARVGVLLALIAIGFFLPLAASASGTGLRAGALACAAIFLVIAAPSVYVGRKRGGGAALNTLRWFGMAVCVGWALLTTVALIYRTELAEFALRLFLRFFVRFP